MNVVVGRRQVRRTLVRPDDAALGKGPGLVAVERAGKPPRRRLGRQPFRRLRRQGRDSAVRGIRDERRAPRRQSLRHRRAQPDLVVVVDVRRVAVDLIQPPLPRFRICDLDRVARRRVDALGRQLRLQRGRFLLREERLVAQVFGPLQGGEGLGGPIALQVRLAVGQARQGPRRCRRGPAPGRILGGSRRRPHPPDRDHRHPRCTTAIGHRRSPWACWPGNRRWVAPGADQPTPGVSVPAFDADRHPEKNA